MPRFNVVGLVGPAYGEAVNEGVTTDGWGVKAVIELDAKPTDQTLASGSATYSSIANSLEVQTKAGLKIFGDVYCGPEAKFTWKQILTTSAGAVPSATQPQTQIATTRLGAHLSAFKYGQLLMGVSGGWIQDRQLGNGYYGSAWIYHPF
jgi:hypothetical protein